MNNRKKALDTFCMQDYNIRAVNMNLEPKGFKYMFLKVGPNKLCGSHIMEIDRDRSCGVGEVNGSNKI